MGKKVSRIKKMPTNQINCGHNKKKNLKISQNRNI